MNLQSIVKNTSLLVIAVLLAYAVYWYYTNQISSSSTDESVTTAERSGFDNELSTLSSSLRADTEEALRQATQLVAQAESPYEEGRAKLALGLVLLRLDLAEAVTVFKEVSTEPTYHPFTRARATWYAVGSYLNTNDTTLANEHLYTGPTWEDFRPNAASDSVTSAMLDQASMNALSYSFNIYATPQAAAQLAVLDAKLLDAGTPESPQKQALIASIQEQLTLAENLLARIDTVDRQFYANTSFVVKASTLDTTALALDYLHLTGAEVTAAQVEERYRAALAAAMERQLDTDHEYRIRYHLADYLLRTDADANRNEIIELLTPMTSLSGLSHLALSFYNTFTNDAVVTPAPTQPGSRETMIRLAKLSPEFKSLLLSAGVSAEQLTSSE